MQLFKGAPAACVLRQTVTLNRVCVTKAPHIYENNPLCIYHTHHMLVGVQAHPVQKVLHKNKFASDWP